MDHLDSFRCNICGNRHELCFCDYGYTEDAMDDVLITVKRKEESRKASLRKKGRAEFKRK